MKESLGRICPPLRAPHPARSLPQEWALQLPFFCCQRYEAGTQAPGRRLPLCKTKGSSALKEQLSPESSHDLQDDTDTQDLTWDSDSQPWASQAWPESWDLGLGPPAPK